MKILDLETGEERASVPGNGPILGAAGIQFQITTSFSPDGALLASVTDNRFVQLWDVATWKKVGQYRGNASILRFSSDGQLLLRGHIWPAGGNGLAIDDVTKRKTRGNFTLPLAQEFGWSELSPDGRTIAYRSGKTNTVVLFDAESGEERWPQQGHLAMANAIGVSPDGGTLVSSGHDHRVLLWDLAEGRVSRELDFVPEAYRIPFDAQFSTSGRWVAAKFQATTTPAWIRIWDTTSGEVVATLRGKAGGFHRGEFAFHPDGRRLVTAEGELLQLWFLPEGASADWPVVHQKPIRAVDWQPGGTHLASADMSGRICLWDAVKREVVDEVHCGGAPWRVRFNPAGTLLAAVTDAPAAALYVWDLSTGTLTRRDHPDGGICGLAWRPDGQELATVSFTGAVRIWSPDDQPPTRTIDRLPPVPGPRQLAYTPEGRHVLLGGPRGAIYVLRFEAIR